MTRVKSASGAELRVFLCLAFDPHVPPGTIHQFEQALVARPEVVHAVEVEGAFNFMVEAAFDSLAECHDFIDRCTMPVAGFLRERRVSFLCRRYLSGPERSIWIRENGGKVRIDLDRIDRVAAEGDYVRLTIDQHDHLHHATMTAMEAVLDPNRFARIHRSEIVRLSTILRVRRDAHGGIAECRDGSVHRVSKSHWEPLIAALGAGPGAAEPVESRPQLSPIQ